jgi:hypothetical protein
MCFANSPRGVTNNRSMGPKPTSQKTEFKAGQRYGGRPFQHGLMRRVLHILRILGLFYVELTMSCYFKLA